MPDKIEKLLSGRAYEKRFRIIRAAVMELDSAMAKQDGYNSAHEGMAVLWEEVEELWDEVKKRKEKRDIKAMRKEALQVAAVAMRFALECCGGDDK